jgi:hypothetical protein
MSGAVQAVASAAAGYGANRCVVNDVGGGVRRSGENGGGALTPNSSFKGTTIVQADCIGTTLGFRIYIYGVVSQDFFSKLVVQDSAGVFRTLTSASADSFANPSNSSWDWTVAGGTSLVWPAAGGPYLLQLYP